jgi:hypothetical protein
MMRRYIGVMCCAIFVGWLAGPAVAQAPHKTVKECDAEWQADKANLQAAGKKKKDFMAECRGIAAAAPAEPPATAPATPPPAAPKPVSPPPPAAKPAPAPMATTGESNVANQFATEVQAHDHCPAITVVWANLKSKVYHFAGTPSYGATKRGAYMCEQDAIEAGMRAAKNETHP